MNQVETRELQSSLREPPSTQHTTFFFPLAADVYSRKCVSFSRSSSSPPPPPTLPSLHSTRAAASGTLHTAGDAKQEPHSSVDTTDALHVHTCHHPQIFLKPPTPLTPLPHLRTPSNPTSPTHPLHPYPNPYNLSPIFCQRQQRCDERHRGRAWSGAAGFEGGNRHWVGAEVLFAWGPTI